MKKETNLKDSSLKFLHVALLSLPKNGDQAGGKDTRRAFIQTEGVQGYSESLKKVRSNEKRDKSEKIRLSIFYMLLF